MTYEERRLKELTKCLSKVYDKAQRELTEKINAFFANFQRLDNQKRLLLSQGKITQAEYNEWRKNKILMSEKYMDLRDTMADRMLHANEIAAQYINGELPGVYAHNFNQVVTDANATLKGFSFDLVDENTVRNLSTQHRTLLPYKFVDGRRDVRWNTKNVNAAVLQGILQGETIPQIAKRLQGVTTMNKVSAIRNARTALTGAQNQGRLDGMKEMQDDGVIVEKEWLAQTGDGRTRDAHLELHHVTMPIDKPFVNSIGQIMFPGDPSAAPANVYNCRCTIAQVIKGFRERTKEESKSEEEKVAKNVEFTELFTPEQLSAAVQRLAELEKQYPVDFQFDFVGDGRIPRGLPHEDLMDLRKPYNIGENAQYVHLRGKNEQFRIDIFDETLQPEPMDKMFDSLYRLRKEFDNDPSMSNALYFASYGMEGTLTHEYGHALQDSCGFFTKPTPEGADFLKWLSDYGKEHKTECLAISRYAAEGNPSELFAEAFVTSFDVNHKDTMAYRTAKEIMDEFKRRFMRKR